MALTGEDYPNTDPVVALGEHVRIEALRMQAELARIDELHGFFKEALPVVTDLAQVNTLLSEAGRDDLVITDPVLMRRVDSVTDDMLTHSNYVPYFQVSTGSRQETKTTFIGITKTRDVRIPVTEDQLLEICRGNLMLDNSTAGHARREAFVRMLVLFPEFVVPLTLDFSILGYPAVHKQRVPDLFIAYQLMSKLVDRRDAGVIGRDGEVNEGYFSS